MRVIDYDYNEYDEFEEGIEEIPYERKQELIEKIKKNIVKGNIPLYKILEICENDGEDNFVYNWLEENSITIGGIAGSLSGEYENYKHIPKMGQSYIPPVLESEEQEKLFNELDELKTKGVDRSSDEYRKIRNKLVEHNMRLARWVARTRYLKDLGYERQDIEQIAMEALIKDYDISYGTKFSTYAVPTIYYSIRNKWRTVNGNKEELKSTWKRLERFEEEMLASINREPTDEEIMQFLGITETKLEALKKYIKFNNQESLEHINEDDEDLIIDGLLDDERIQELQHKKIINGVYIDEFDRKEEIDDRSIDKTIIYYSMRQELEDILEEFRERERLILKARFGLNGEVPKTLEQVRTYVWCHKRVHKTNRSKSIK